MPAVLYSNRHPRITASNRSRTFIASSDYPEEAGLGSAFEYFRS
jgi:hypothetical protein